MSVVFFSVPRCGLLRSATDGIDEDVIVVSKGLIHRITQQPGVLDVTALGCEGICIVVGNHDFGSFVVDIGLEASS